MREILLLTLLLSPLPAFADAPSTTTVKPDYSELEQHCEKAQSKSCCMASVNRMRERKYLLSTAPTLRETVCPKGYRADMLRCRDSFRWCAPKKGDKPQRVGRPTSE